MTYDFDRVTQRRGTDSVKWSVAEGELPMWVADMDFQTAPEILEALQRRLDHGIFGYATIPESWYDAYIGWWQRRHGFRLERDALLFCTGVVPAISSVIRALTAPDAAVVLQTPVYNMFFRNATDNGRRVAENPLCYRDGAYTVDFADLEAKLADPRTEAMILCNPHNPIGKLWDAPTLERIGALCLKHHVLVISDEIHCDLTLPGRGYIPFASVSAACRDNSITCLAPTKTFNLAGLHSAALSVPDREIRRRVQQALHTDSLAEPGSFAVCAAEAAYGQGAPWLDALRDYLAENRRRVAEFLAAEVPGVRLVAGEATYLLWLETGLPSRALAAFLRARTGLFVTAGAVYGAPGDRFLRMNVACPRSVLEDGLRRLQEGMAAWTREKGENGA